MCIRDSASTLAENVYDTAKGEGISYLQGAVEGAPEANAEQYRQQSRQGLETQIEYNLINQLVRNGYLGEQSPGDATPNPGVPDSLLVPGPNGTQIINPHLYDSDGVDKIGAEGQYTDAQIAQMRKDWNSWRGSNSYNIVNSVVTRGSEGFDREVNKGP